MNLLYTFLLCDLAVSVLFVQSAVLPDDEVEEQGLYKKSDLVDILTNRNLERKIYGQKHALLVQFYNSFCGHCRAFMPKYKTLASEMVHWRNVIRPAVMDCSVEENSEICRQFEVMAYPSLRYLHENYVKGNSNVGEKIQIGDGPDKLKVNIISKLQNEQARGRLQFAPSFNIASYSTYAQAISDVPKDVKYTFLVFENANSTVGSELALDVSDYDHVRIKRVYDTSELANIAGIRQFPGLVLVDNNANATPFTPKGQAAENLLKEVNAYLRSKNYVFPVEYKPTPETNYNEHGNDKPLPNADVVYYSDLEKTLKNSLHTEITRYKTLTGEPLQALLEYLDVLIFAFPFRGNLREFIVDLRATMGRKNSWSGAEVYDAVKNLETFHAPVYTSNLEYVSCKGSQPKYRGYTCGLWTLFHTLTINAAQKPGVEGPKVLKAMHGYVKHFFGCTECSEHFQAMAARNRIFDVKENDKAVLWLWISHNEVNLRLAGDITEDPEHPKIQFPSATRCPECRLPRGAWNLPAVYQYLQSVYSAGNIRDQRWARSAAVSPSPFSNLDIGMLSLLYIFSFVHGIRWQTH
ncbi:sulfhydryl oxidase 1 isoform X2 [Manduca sexta]|uniref:sulfhydryl oxidase 1 isoform X2 n=1 Tax=Manduca sexta TaxID=7130 RepID=UPI0011826884|nr:sulfhydryl oxidase 1 isoform X2 [Manduca sexta]